MDQETRPFETPFADEFLVHEEPSVNSGDNLPVTQAENPFLKTFEVTGGPQGGSPFASEAVSMLAELNDPAFARNLYELASELEDSWLPLVSGETTENFLPLVARQAKDYFRPLIKASDGMIDRIARRIHQDSLTGVPVSETETFLNEFHPDGMGLTPVQEQFLGSVFNKVKNAVKAGIKLVGKVLPVNIILDKLKGLIKPLLERVLKFAIGKLPKNLQPYAQMLAKKLLSFETGMQNGLNEEQTDSSEITGIQTELDSQIARLVYSTDENETEWLLKEYETPSGNLSLNGADEPAPDAYLKARRQFIQELSQLETGESPAPSVERFLPAVMALKPVIKMGISLAGRPKIISFLAGLLSKLVEKYVPANVAHPLAASIIDTGMSAIGFETAEMNSPEIGYEALTNTIEETILNMNLQGEDEDQETLTLNLLEAFETAAADNFPSQYIKQELRKSMQPGAWVMKPRKGASHAYKKFTTIFNVTIDPEKVRTVLTFRKLPLADFFRDKLGLDVSKPLQARIHLYEAIQGTRLFQISKHESLPGFNKSIRNAWIQLHPLTKQAASALINEPGLGKDFPADLTARHHQITSGQRFYFIEIEGARLRNGTGTGIATPPHSADVSVRVDFVKSSLTISYYFSEEQAQLVAGKLNNNDLTGALTGIRHAVKNVLHQMLSGTITNKVKIVHESIPELYLENYTGEHENLPGLGKSILLNLVQNLVNHISGKAFESVKEILRSRSAEFRQAQAEPQDGVTVIISWNHVAGLSSIKSFITGIRTGQFINPASLVLPTLDKPEINIRPGKSIS